MEAARCRLRYAGVRYGKKSRYAGDCLRRGDREHGIMFPDRVALFPCDTQTQINAIELSGIAEASTQGLERGALIIEFLRGAKPQAAQHHQRWTPFLNCMPEHERRNRRGKHLPFPVDAGAGHQPGQGNAAKTGSMSLPKAWRQAGSRLEPRYFASSAKKT